MGASEKGPETARGAIARRSEEVRKMLREDVPRESSQISFVYVRKDIVDAVTAYHFPKPESRSSVSG